jgi:glycosyltransferase involved in cell wall biosynthesis
MLKVAVVTPYYQETEAVLRQCHDSVLNQTFECHHILVADGHPTDIFDGDERTLHVKLPVANGDNGNTPRAIGGLLAASYGFDAVAYLDADNWYYENHIQRLVLEHELTKAPLICSKRTFHDQHGNALNINEADEDAHLHIDTSCWIVFRPAFSLLRAWLMPKELGPLCDRVFLRKALHERFQIRAVLDRTVAFRTQYKYHYDRAGVPPPPNVKTSKEMVAAARYLETERGIAHVVAELGFFPKNLWPYYDAYLRREGNES